jgi:hypothetical protein
VSNDTKTKAPRLGNVWYEEFDLPPRFPRPPLKQIAELIESITEPQIFLSEGERFTDIVIRMPVPSDIFPPGFADSFGKFDVTLAKAFDDVLWQKLRENGSTTWAELSRLGMNVYRQAWNQWAELQYLGHFHPAAEAMFKEIKRAVDSASKKAQRGRRATTLAELAGLEKRYEQLLPKCELIHQAAVRAVALARTKNNRAIAEKEIRRAIWDAVRSSIHGMPGDGYVFGGKAFERIDETTKLHNPKTWSPRQLAIALLSLERNQAYETIEKKLSQTKRQRNPEAKMDANNENNVGVR